MGMQSHVFMHPSLQVAKCKTQRRTGSRLVVWVNLVPAGCTCPFLKAGGGVKIYCPMNGVFGSRSVFLEAALRPERGLLS